MAAVEELEPTSYGCAIVSHSSVLRSHINAALAWSILVAGDLPELDFWSNLGFQLVAWDARESDKSWLV